MQGVWHEKTICSSRHQEHLPANQGYGCDGNAEVLRMWNSAQMLDQSLFSINFLGTHSLSTNCINSETFEDPLSCS
jgi:hypothetical protein